MTHLKHSILAALALGVQVSQTHAASWQAHPIVVHEWGVNLHDWRGAPLRATHDPLDSKLEPSALVSLRSNHSQGEQAHPR